MTFARPELLAFAPLAVLIIGLAVVAQWRRQLRLVDAYGGATAATRLAGRPLHHFPTARLVGLLAAAIVLSIGGAGPERVQDIDSESPVDVVIAVDLSLSMLAEDVGESRADRAARVVDRALQAIPGDRVGVTVFADWPYTLVPMTDDPDVVSFFASSMSPDIVAERDQGTGLGEAIGAARRELSTRLRPEASALIVVVSDGEVHGQTAVILDSISAAVEEGVELWTAGVGTSAGGTLPSGTEGAPALDATGQPIVTQLDAGVLRELARAGGGDYYDISDDRGSERLISELARAAGETERGLDGPSLSFWLIVFGLIPLALDGALDVGRLRDPLAREG